MPSTIALNKLMLAEAKYKRAAGQLLAVDRKYTKKPVVKQTKLLANKVKQLSKRVNAGTATHTRRRADCDVIGTVYNQATYGVETAFSTGRVENALSLLRYYDPATPTTLVTADGNSGSYNREFLFDRCSSKCTIRNNSQVALSIRVYYCVPKEDTSLAPNTTISQGYTDQMITNGITSPNMYPTDSEQFRSLWKIKKSWNRFLDAGSRMTCFQATPDFTYEPSNVDHHGLTYQSKYGAGVWLFRVVGEVSHNSNNNGRLLNGGFVDYHVQTTQRITYDAGTSLEDYSVDEYYGTASAPVVMTNKPMADNQSESVA